MSLGSRVKLLRDEKNISRQELADYLGIAYSTLSGYENDQRFPDRDIINKLADFFDVSNDYLLERSNEKKVIPANSAFNINVAELDDEDIEIIKAMVERLKLKHKKPID